MTKNKPLTVFEAVGILIVILAFICGFFFGATLLHNFPQWFVSWW